MLVTQRLVGALSLEKRRRPHADTVGGACAGREFAGRESSRRAPVLGRRVGLVAMPGGTSPVSIPAVSVEDEYGEACASDTKPVEIAFVGNEPAHQLARQFEPGDLEDQRQQNARGYSDADRGPVQVPIS